MTNLEETIEFYKHEPTLQEAGISDRVIPEAIKYMDENNIMVNDTIKLLRAIIDAVKDDLITYKNETYDEYCLAFPGTSMEEFEKERPDVEQKFFERANFLPIFEFECTVFDAPESDYPSYE